MYVVILKSGYAELSFEFDCWSGTTTFMRTIVESTRENITIELKYERGEEDESVSD